MSDVTFERVVYFGDSLTDQGISFALTDQVLFLGVPFQAAGYSEWYSDGPVYSTYAAELLGIEDVETYAIASARAVGSRSLQEFIDANLLTPLITPGADTGILATDINLGAQVASFLAEGPIVPGTAVSLLIGLNDYNNFSPSTTDPLTTLAEAQALITDVVSNTLVAIGALVAGGAETVILNTLPESLFFPGSNLAPEAIQELGTFAIDAHNDALIAGAASLSAEVKIIDFQALSAEIMVDQQTFGFLAPLTSPKVLTAIPQISITDGITVDVTENPLAATLDDDQFAFLDFLHPTTALHGILGSFQAASLTHETVFNQAVVGTGAERDLIFSGEAADQVASGRKQDIVFAGLEDDMVTGQRARDILAGGAGNDTLRGGAGADVLAGGTGDDMLFGGRGADVLIDGLGSDISAGGLGSDTFVFVEAELIGGVTGTDNDEVRGGAGTDTLVMVLSAETRATVEAGLSQSRFQVFETIGVEARSIEEFVFVDSRADLADLEVNARLAEADLWGLI
ncbi:MAG: SGNH/GDSL hydrolase family protein [Pseudomonadota bacterium]